MRSPLRRWSLKVLAAVVAGSLTATAESADVAAPADPSDLVDMEAPADPVDPPDPAVAAGAAQRFGPLLEDSPFLTLAFKARMGQTQAVSTRNLSFTGYAKIDGQWLLCIYNKREGSFNWLRIADTFGDFVVKGFDLKKEAIILTHNNRNVSLALENP